MGQGTAAHQPWCAPGCRASESGIHASAPSPVTPTGGELLGITVRLEELVAGSQFTAVVLEVTQDDAAMGYFMPIVQARALHGVIGTVLRWVSASA